MKQDGQYHSAFSRERVIAVPQNCVSMTYACTGQNSKTHLSNVEPWSRVEKRCPIPLPLPRPVPSSRPTPPCRPGGPQSAAWLPCRRRHSQGQNRPLTSPCGTLAPTPAGPGGCAERLCQRNRLWFLRRSPARRLRTASVLRAELCVSLRPHTRSSSPSSLL